MARDGRSGVRRTASERLLMASLLFLAAGGFYGGVAMLIDPSGGVLTMEEILPRLPVADLVLPGIFLLFVMGAAPLAVAYGLWTERTSGPNPTRRSAVGRPLSWARAAIALALILLGWLILQGFLIGFRWPIQYLTAANGLVILAAASRIDRQARSVRGAGARERGGRRRVHEEPRT